MLACVIRSRLWFCVAPAILILSVPAPTAAAAEPDVKEIVKKAVAAVGGQDKLLQLFTMRERLVVNATVPPPPDAETKSNRTSVLEPPGHWWVGKRDRVVEDKEPAAFLVYGWTLGILLDQKSVLEPIAETRIGRTAVVGIRVGGTVSPPMEMYFDLKDYRLTAIDWRQDRHLFSEWKQTDDGAWYASRAVGIKFADAKKKVLAKQQWYQTDILELKRLKELPAGLSR